MTSIHPLIVVPTPVSICSISLCGIPDWLYRLGSDRYLVWELGTSGGLALNIPYDVVQDDQVVALVQVTSPDADLSDIPENWDIIDFAEKSDYPEEDPSDYNSEVQDEEFYPNPDSEIDEDQDSYQEPDDYDYDPDMGVNNDSYSEPDDYQEYYSDS